MLSKHLLTNPLSVPSANDIDLNTIYTNNNILSLKTSFNSGYANILKLFSNNGATISLSKFYYSPLLSLNFWNN